MKRKETISSTNDPILEKMLKLPEQFKDMNVLESTCSSGVMCLTSDINYALYVTLMGLVSLQKLFLNHVFSYILAG